MFVLYTLDIVILFNTSYVEVSTGDEIFSNKYIAGHYVKSVQFYLDFFATFPFNWIPIENQTYITFSNLIKMLKVTRMMKIYKQIRELNAKIETKAVFKMLFAIVFILIFLHLQACILMFSFKTDFLWVAPTDFGSIRSRLFNPWSLYGDTQADIMSNIDDFELFKF